MCEVSTSHLYKMYDGPVVYDTSSHSGTREALGIYELDLTYAEVEWDVYRDMPRFRLPSVWLSEQRDQCRAWYAKHMPARKDMIRWCVTHAVVVTVDASSGYVLNTIEALPRCQMLICSECYNLRKLPSLPACRRLILRDCSEVARPADLPEDAVVEQIRTFARIRNDVRRI